MARGHAIARNIASQSKTPLNTCKSCLFSLQRFASTATALASNPADSESPVPAPSSPHPVVSVSTQPAYQIKAAVLLSRPPILTRDLTPFEKAFYLYQRRLNERLALPFTRYFYYQRGTPGDVDWKRKIKVRQTPARDIGVYNAYSEEGWNDELLIGAKESEPEEQINALVEDATVEEKESEEVEGVRKRKVEKIDKPMPRVTEADRIGDLKSLNRYLTRTLHLTVKSKQPHHKAAQWGFPSSELTGKESLHTAAERILIQSCGLNMNTWVVGNMPIAHRTLTYPHPRIDPETGAELRGEKLFFMKARIMAGQADLKGNHYGLLDFKWLAKDEVMREVDGGLAKAVRNAMAER